MEQFSIILSSLSALAVIVAILFEGKLKIKKKVNSSSLQSEISALTKYGWILIILSVLMSLGNGFMTYHNIASNKKQYRNDTIKISALLTESYTLNKKLRGKNISDSLRIDNLVKLTRENGLKSDLIKFSVVDNAVKALNEQRLAIERERENVFLHLQKEVKDNLAKILHHYDEKIIRSYEDTTIFSSSRLSDIYITKYESISNNKIIIEKFMRASEMIKQLNYFADKLLYVDLKYRKLDINTFLKVKVEVYNRLIPIFAQIDKLKSYKEYEAIDLSKKNPSQNIDNQRLKDSLFLEIAYPVYDKRTN